jgi:hypothetical protein
MTDLQLGLLVIGVAVVAGVLIYNRTQERGVRRAAQRAFGSQHADALLGESAQHQEKTAWTAPRKTEAHAGDMPDARLDYVIDLEVARGTLPATVLEHWKGLQHRFASRVLLAGSDGAGWRPVAAGDVRSLIELRASLQMVSRAGVVGDAELLEFRSGVETLGAALGARAAAPEMREALDAARALDKLCADADIQVALHVVGGTSHDGLDAAEQPFRTEIRVDGVSFTLDVPRNLEPARGFEAMARAARQFAATSGGCLVDDNGNALDERALLAIGAELDAVRARLVEAGIEPGSALALRLFS